MKIIKKIASTIFVTSVVAFFGFLISFATPAFADVINPTTTPATSITTTDATFNGTNGTSNATGSSFWVSLAPFVTTSPTIPTGVYSTVDLGSVVANTPFSALLSSATGMPMVTPSTTYYYAAWSNVEDTWYPGDVLSFTTLPVVLPGTLSAEDFGVNSNTGLGTVNGYATGFGVADNTFASATSVVVKLYATGDVLLQTNTAILPKFNTDITGVQFSSPFDVSGSFNYVTDGYWTNVREIQYGQSVPAVKVVATVTLANGKVVTAENTNMVGDATMIYPTILSGTLAAEDFGVVNYDSGLGWNKGYTAGFGVTDTTFTGATSVVVRLYAADDVLLQTNTAILPKFNTDITGVQFSSPFDVSGNFQYATDGYWTNVKAAQYGQSVPATKVVATVTLANGKVVTAENTTLTGDAPSTIYPFILTYTAGTNGTITGATSQTVGSGLNGTTVTAVANSGYHFVNWSDNSSTVATRTDLNVTGNITTTANFVANGGGGGGGGGYSTTPAVPAHITIPDGCALGNKFSTTTGRNCNTATPAVPAGKVLGAERYNFTQFMKKGSKGNEIMELQRFIMENGGFDSGALDGKFGPKTESAFKKFQSKNGLKMDGIVGQNSRIILNR